jgi:hypothetical protein
MLQSNLSSTVPQFTPIPTATKHPKHKTRRYKRHYKKTNHQPVTYCRNTQFSKCLSVVIPPLETLHLNPELCVEGNAIIWSKESPIPFTELILSWNAAYPQHGTYSFWVNIKHQQWSGWRKLAEWGREVEGNKVKKIQKTFTNRNKVFLDLKYVRTVVRQNRKGVAYQIKVVANSGASLNNIKALFANVADQHALRIKSPTMLPSVAITEVPKQSQWQLPHERTKDLCSPTSLSMVTRYFINKFNLPSSYETLNGQATAFANNVRDQSLDIYGNWLFNVAHAFNVTRGKILYRVQRLNDFEELYTYLAQEIPIAVSIHGWLRGCAWPYRNGHFIVVTGWDQKNRRVICIDPAFRQTHLMKRAYRINDFMRAWGKSCNLSYVPILPKLFQTSPM